MPKTIEHGDGSPNADANTVGAARTYPCPKHNPYTVQPVYLVRIEESKSQSALPKQVTHKWSNPADAAFCFVVGLELKPRLHSSVNIILKTERRLSKVSEDDDLVKELGSDFYTGS